MDEQLETISQVKSTLADGHVGLCGTRLEAATVKHYVSESLRLRV